MVLGILNNIIYADSIDGTIYVSTSGNDTNNGLTLNSSKRTIQNALDTAKAGDTIKVCNGTYKEHITINKDVFLVGENREKTIIDGTNNGTIATIKSDINVSLDGFTIIKQL